MSTARSVRAASSAGVSTGPSWGVGVFHVKHTHATPVGSVGRAGSEPLGVRPSLSQWVAPLCAVRSRTVRSRTVRSRTARAASGFAPRSRAGGPSTPAPSTRRPPGSPGPGDPGRALLGRASVDLPPVGRTRWPASTPRHAGSSRIPAAAHRVGASGPGVPDTVTGRRHRPDSTGNAEVRRSHRVLPAATSDEPTAPRRRTGRRRAHPVHGDEVLRPARRRGPHRPGRPRREETSTRSPCPCGAYEIATRLIPQRGRSTPELRHPQATRSRDRARRAARRPPRRPSLFHVKHRRRPPRTRSPAVPRPPERAAGPSSARATQPRGGRPVPLAGRARPMGTPYDRRPGPTTSRSTRDHHRCRASSDIRTTDQACSGRYAPRHRSTYREKRPIGQIQRLSGPTRLLRPTPASPPKPHASAGSEAT